MSTSHAAEGYGTEKKPSEVKKYEKEILEALKVDVDTLANKFLSDPSDLSLKRFGQIFNDMEFSTIFIGRFTFGDLVEFSENLFHYVGSFMFGSLANRPLPAYVMGDVSQSKADEMFPTPSEERKQSERIFGIFLTYSLYFLQPSQYVIPVFVTAPQLDDLYEFMATELLPEENFEALYCIYRLVQSSAFAVYPFDGKFNPMLYRHFNLLDKDPFMAEVRKIENIEDLGRLKELADSPLLQQAEKMHIRYMEQKRQNMGTLPQSSLAPRDGPHAMLNKLINEAEEKLAKNRKRRESETGQQRDPISTSILSRVKAEAMEGLEHPKTVLSRRNKIRQQAFAQGIMARRDRRHRFPDGEEAVEQSVPKSVKKEKN